MLVDLVVSGRKALVVGGDSEAEFKVTKLLDAGAAVTVVAGSFTKSLRSLASSKKIKLLKTRDVSEGAASALTMKPFVVFVSTGEAALDAKVASMANAQGSLVCVVDAPQHNDVNMPAVAKLGDIRVAISTGGKSPAMASILRKRVEGLIKPEDVLQVRLQGYIRVESRKYLKDAASRKDFVYKVIGDPKVVALLHKNKYEDARRRAVEMLLAEKGV